MALPMRREQKPPAGVSPGSEPAHTSTLIRYTKRRDTIVTVGEKGCLSASR